MAKINLSKDAREIVWEINTKIKPKGCRFEVLRIGKHVVCEIVFPDDTRKKITMSLTPSDRRAKINIVAMVMREILAKERLDQNE